MPYMALIKTNILTFAFIFKCQIVKFEIKTFPIDKMPVVQVPDAPPLPCMILKSQISLRRGSSVL